MSPEEKVVLTPVTKSVTHSVILVEKRLVEPEVDDILFEAVGPNHGLVVSKQRKGTFLCSFICCFLVFRCDLASV